jgi:hypothetical protein
MHKFYLGAMSKFRNGAAYIRIWWNSLARRASRSWSHAIGMVRQSNKEIMPDKILFDSPELACFHEAGHAEVALAVGAQVVEMVLYRESPRSFGRTSVIRTDQQRRRIALGGFGAEYRLYKSGRLMKHDGVPPTEKEFIDYSIGNARDDWVSFFGEGRRDANGGWPGELDRQFMSYAIGQADGDMQFEIVERIAEALISAGKLDGATVVTIKEASL